MHPTIEKPLAEIYMHVSSGKKYFPFSPSPADVSINVIAHQLANCGRWNGATQHPIHEDRIFYSVAEHSVYVSEYVEHVLGCPEFALEALLHDASEAFIGDLIRPLKYSKVFAEPFRQVEDLNELAIADAFDLLYPWPKVVKIADEAICAAEFNQIVPRDPDLDWTNGRLHSMENVADVKIEMLYPHIAKASFLARYADLTRVRGRQAA